MYKITCDGLPILDSRHEDYIVLEPKVTVETNTVGECTFKIYSDHPHYNDLHSLKSTFEVSDENGVIFRGRMTNNTRDFYNGKAVDLEGSMAFFNDSMVKPFVFPDDFSGTSSSGNMVAYFLNWLIENHNSQVQEFQKFKLGNVTVTDPNNYLSRSNEKIASTWQVLKEKLFESSLGGDLCIRYEADGNYIDYLADFEEINEQAIIFGENLLDMKYETDASTTYSAIIPIGADIEIEPETEDGETITETVTLESINDGAINDDIYKITLGNGLHALYSKTAVENYGWICCPVEDSTWDDVTDAGNLLTKASAFLSGTGMFLSNHIEATAADLHFTDAQIRSFRIYKKVRVVAKPHGVAAYYKLTKLGLDLLNPQNTKIAVGETKKTLTDSVVKNKAADVAKQAYEKAVQAQNTANIANTNATNAKKVATNYMDFAGDYGDGLVIGDLTASILGRNVHIKSDVIELRDGSDTVLASFDEDDIWLGNEGTRATIHLCGNLGRIYSYAGNNSSTYDTLGLVADNLMFVRESDLDTYISLATTEDPDGNMHSSIELFTANGFIESNLILNPAGTYLTAPSFEVMLPTGVGIWKFDNDGLYTDKRIILENNVYFSSYASDGETIHRLIGKNTNDNCVINYESYEFANGNTNVYGKAVYLYSVNDIGLRSDNWGGVCLVDGSAGGIAGFFRPYAEYDAQISLGTSNYRFYRLYQSHSSVSTSDKRQKENIKALKNVRKNRKKNNGKTEEFDVYAELFDRLEPVEYNFIEGQKRKDFGLIAQDVLEVMLELGLEEDELDLVHHDTWIDEETGEEKDGYGIAYENLIALLIHEVQKLKAKMKGN